MGATVLLVMAVLTVSQLCWAQPEGQQYIPRGAVLELTEKNFVKTVQSNPITLVSFLSGNPAEANYEGYLSQQLEYVSGIMTQKGISEVKIATVAAVKYPALIKQLGVQAEARPVMLFRSSSMPQEYFGQRTAEGIAGYLSEVITTKAVRMVSTKAEKKRYEDFDFAKFVAYVEPGSKMEKWFKLAAEHFVPVIPFFQVTDKKIAKSLRLKKTGAALFVKPNEKAVPIPSNIADERSLIRFVYTNRKQALMQVRMVELHLTWSGVMSPNLVLAVVKPKSDVGAHLFGTLKVVAKHFAGNKSLHLAWINPDSDVQPMLPQWTKTFGEDLTTTSAAFGFISLQQNKHVWLDVNKDIKPKQVIQWIDDVLAGKLELKATARPDDTTPQGAATEEDFDIPEEGEDSTASEAERTEL